MTRQFWKDSGGLGNWLHIVLAKEAPTRIPPSPPCRGLSQLWLLYLPGTPESCSPPVPGSNDGSGNTRTSPSGSIAEASWNVNFPRLKDVLRSGL